MKSFLIFFLLSPIVMVGQSKKSAEDNLYKDKILTYKIVYQNLKDSAKLYENKNVVKWVNFSIAKSRIADTLFKYYDLELQRNQPNFQVKNKQNEKTNLLTTNQ